MKLIEAIPSLFERPLPLLEGGTRLVVAGTLLDTPHREVLKIVSTEKERVDFLSRNRGSAVLTGYTVLAGLLKSDPRDFYRFLLEPCERSTFSVRPLSSRAGLAAALEEFERTMFGWAVVGSSGVCAVVTLADLIPLYGSGVLETDLTVRDVASKVFFMPASTKLRVALREMMRRRIRRVFLSGERNKFVSDREVLTYLFSPKRLALARDDPRKFLYGTLADLNAMEALEVDGRSSIRAVSALFKPESGAWCLICDGGLVTPWDMVMKPWKWGRLKIREPAPKTTAKRGGPSGVRSTLALAEVLRKQGFSVKLGSLVEGKSGVKYRVDVLAENPEGRRVVGFKSLGKAASSEILNIYVTACDIGADAHYLPGSPMDEESRKLAEEYKITIRPEEAGKLLIRSSIGRI